MLAESGLERVRDRLLLLRSLQTLEGLDDDGFALLAEYSRPRAFRKGARILEAGRPVESLYVVTSGAVEVSRDGRVSAGSAQPPALGYLPFFARDPRGVEAVALQRTHTLEIPCHVLLGVLETNFSLVRNSLRVLSTQRVLSRNGKPPASSGEAPDAAGPSAQRPPTLVERILELHQGVLFRKCNLDAVIEACRQMRLVRWKAGEVLWSRGEPATTWLRVTDGRVRCDGDGGQQSLVWAGFALGIDDALGSGLRSFSATALTEVSGFEMSVDAFLQLLSGHFDVARELLALLASDLLQRADTQAQDGAR